MDYRREDVSARVKEITRGAGVDRVIDVAFGRNLATNLAVLETNGTIAAYASDAEPNPAIPFYPMMSRGIGIRLVLVFNMPAADLARAAHDICSALLRGKLRHPPIERFSLERTAAAHEAVESGRVTGKVVVDISPSAASVP